MQVFTMARPTHAIEAVTQLFGQYASQRQHLQSGSSDDADPELTSPPSRPLQRVEPSERSEVIETIASLFAGYSGTMSYGDRSKRGASGTHSSSDHDSYQVGSVDHSPRARQEPRTQQGPVLQRLAEEEVHVNVHGFYEGGPRYRSEIVVGAESNATKRSLGPASSSTVHVERTTQQAEASALHAEIAALRAENEASSALHAEIAALRAENEAFSALHAEIAALRAENAALKLEQQQVAARLEGSVKVLETKSKSIDIGVRGNEVVLDEARMQVKELQDRCDRLTDERIQLASRCAQAEQDIYLAKRQGSVASTALQSRGTQLEAQNQVLQTEKRQMTAKLAEMQHTLAAHEDNAAYADATQRSVQQRYGDEVSRLSGLVKHTAQLAAQVAHMQHDNARLLALLRSTEEYESLVRKGFPRVGGGSDPNAPALFHRSTYLGGLPQPRTVTARRFLGGVHNKDPLVHASEEDGSADWKEADGLSDELRWDEVPRLEAEYGALAMSVNTDGTAVLEDKQGQAVATRHVPQSSRVYIADVLDDFGGEMADETAVDAAVEVQYWVPSDAASLCSRFRRKYMSQVPAEIVAAFLLGLNVVWLRRCDEMLADANKGLKHQLKELRLFLQRREPYKEVMQASTIKKLYTELSALRQAVGKTAGRPDMGIPTTTERSPSPTAFGSTIPQRDRTGRSLAESFRAPQRSRGRSPSPQPATRDELQAAVDMVNGKGSMGHVQGAVPGGLSASLLSVPGSGARRYDAKQSGALLEAALEAVDALTGQVERAEMRVQQLKDVLRRLGLTEADIIALQQPASGGKAGAHSGEDSPQAKSAKRSPQPLYPVTTRPGSPTVRRRSPGTAPPAAATFGYGPTASMPAPTPMTPVRATHAEAFLSPIAPLRGGPSSWPVMISPEGALGGRGGTGAMPRKMSVSDAVRAAVGNSHAGGSLSTPSRAGSFA